MENNFHNSQMVFISRKEYNELQTLKKEFECQNGHFKDLHQVTHEALMKELSAAKKTIENLKNEKAFCLERSKDLKNEVEEHLNEILVLNVKATTLLKIIDKKDNQIRAFQDFLDGSSSSFEKYQVFLAMQEVKSIKFGGPRVSAIECKRGHGLKGQMQKMKLRRMVDTIEEGKMLEFD